MSLEDLAKKAEEGFEKVVDAAKEKDPNFTLTFDGPAFNDYWTKVKTRMVASDAPCILTTQAARAQELSGLLEPLDSYMEAAGIKASDYNAAMMQGMTVDGKVLALPYDAEPDVLYYNREMFEKAGLEAPSTSYTTEQFLKDAKALTGDGKYGIAVNALCPGYFYSELTTDVLDAEDTGSAFRSMIPLGRFGKEGELDTAILFLASKASSYVVGSPILVDGGYSAI